MSRYSFNYILLIAVLLLIIWGVLILASASASLSWEKYNQASHFLEHQILLGLIPGLALAFLAFKLRLSFFRKNAVWIYLGSLVLSALVFVPKIGARLGGASRWITVGSVAFQPSELLKVSIILYFAFWLSRIKVKGKFPIISFFVLLLPAILILSFQPDISTLVMIVAVGALIYFAAGTPIWHSIIIFLSGATVFFGLIKVAPYRMNRILAFLKPGLDPMGIGYQLKQSLIGIGSGGILGKGLGLSRQKFGFLPHPMSDSIFAVLSEEAGFIGALTLILLFLIFLWQGIKTSKLASDCFSKLVALGITSWITIQALVNIGSMIGILPLTGIPLPFISYGGSHLVTELIGVGILLNISKAD